MAIKLIGNPAAASRGFTADVFAIGEDGALYQLSQLAPNDGWSMWKNRGAPAGTKLRPSPAVSLQNFIDVVALNPVVIGYDGSLYSLPQHDGGDQWAGPEGGGLAPSPAVANLAQNWLQVVFAVGNDNILQSLGDPFDVGPSQQNPHPGAVVSPSPASAPSQDGRLEVFVVGTDGALWHIWQTAVGGGWSSWYSHGMTPNGGLRGSPALAASQDGRLELFIVGADGALWHIWQTAASDGWSPWYSHGAPPTGRLQGSPAVAASQDGRLELFVVGAHGALWHIWQTQASNGWSGWYSHGTPAGGLQGSPTLAPSQDGRLELFAIGGLGSLWHIWQTQANNGWSGWYSHGTP